MEDILIKITDTRALQMHFDTDETNTAGVSREFEGEVLAKVSLKAQEPCLSVFHTGNEPDHLVERRFIPNDSNFF